MGILKEKFKDPRWRLNNLYYITTKQSTSVKFSENPFQKRINDISAQKKLILKPRQVGISTNEILKQFDQVIWKKNINACILAHKRESLQALFRIPTHALNKMDARIRPTLDRGGGSKYEMRFPEINSRIFCTVEAISQAIQWLHISEAAFIKDPLKAKDTIAAVPHDGIVTYETTANGMDPLFYDTWMDNPDYVKIFFPWFMFPEYKAANTDVKNYTSEEKDFIKSAKKFFGVEITKEQMAFRRAKKKEFKHDFLRYYPEDDKSCFLTGENLPVDLLAISRIQENVPKPIKQTEYLKIWEEKNNSKMYTCSADVAEGVEGDYSVACVFDVLSRRKVAQIRSNTWKPGEFADKIKELCDMYTVSGNRQPLLAVERNNHGHAVLLSLDEKHRYGNLYAYKEDAYGWKTDSVTRPLMLDTYIEAVENETVKETDEETLKELMTLVNNDGKIEAAKGKHDDCIIASAIGVQMCLYLAPQGQKQKLSDSILI